MKQLVEKGDGPWSTMAPKGEIRQHAGDLVDETQKTVAWLGQHEENGNWGWGRGGGGDSQDGDARRLADQHAGMLSFPLIFLPYTLSILHLCYVHTSSVRNPKGQLENCLKKDHIVCANQS